MCKGLKRSYFPYVLPCSPTLPILHPYPLYIHQLHSGVICLSCLNGGSQLRTTQKGTRATHCVPEAIPSNGHQEATNNFLQEALITEILIIQMNGKEALTQAPRQHFVPTSGFKQEQKKPRG